jgi:hypothetical protein
LLAAKKYQKCPKVKTKKSKRRDSSIVAHGEFNVLISAGIEPATFSVLTKCDNPYTTKPHDEVGGNVLRSKRPKSSNQDKKIKKKRFKYCCTWRIQCLDFGRNRTGDLFGVNEMMEVA